MKRLTVRDWYGQVKNPPIGAPDSLAPRRERICALVFDGLPLGEHFVDEPRYEESDMLANVLVACDVDREIASIESLPERGTKRTPDFEALLRGGRAVRIEVTQFADRAVRAYMGDLNSVFTPAQAAWREDAEILARIAGMHIFFDFPDDAPRGQSRRTAADEILRVLRSIEPADVRPMHLTEPPADCKLLKSLNVLWAISAMGQADTRVQFRPPLTLADAGRVIAASSDTLRDKKGKHSDYSDNGQHDVWLAIFVSDGVSYVGLTAIQEMADNAANLDPHPFERLMIGNHVAGVLLDSKQRFAIYRSVSVPYREIARF